MCLSKEDEQEVADHAVGKVHPEVGVEPSYDQFVDAGHLAASNHPEPEVGYLLPYRVGFGVILFFLGLMISGVEVLTLFPQMRIFYIQTEGL